MAGPIYKMWRVSGKEAWYQLSKAEQDALFARLDEARKSVGGKTLLTCDSSWASEHWLFWGMEEFPSIEAEQEFARSLVELNWFRYVESDILLGTTMPADAA